MKNLDREKGREKANVERAIKKNRNYGACTPKIINKKVKKQTI